MYEPGMTTAQLRAIFAELRTAIVPLVREISAKGNAIETGFLHRQYDKEQQLPSACRWCSSSATTSSAGGGSRHHPFATSFSRDDVRITTRYDADWLNPALFGTLHETGHALYELGSADDLEGTFLVGGTSLGIHESQSRMWENLVGRSRGFWTHFFPMLQAYFPDQLGDVTLEAFYRAINRSSRRLSASRRTR